METEEIEGIKGELKHFDTIIKSELSLYYLEGLKLFKICRSLLSALETAQKEIANRAHFESEYRKQLEASQREAEASLTFDRFREANVTRCVKWHPKGIDSWSPSDWLVAVTGELGELASLLKMRNRERDGLPGNKFSPTDKQIADELADVLTYLDLLAATLGVDLGRAAAQKFNEVSERVGFPDRINIPQALARTEKEGG